jgi:hypothetical protein
MAAKYLVLIGILCLVLCVGLCVSVDDVHAQGKKIAAKKPGELGSKEFDEDRLPNKLEMGLGVGSIFVMIAVLKYL